MTRSTLIPRALNRHSAGSGSRWWTGGSRRAGPQHRPAALHRRWPLQIVPASPLAAAPARSAVRSNRPSFLMSKCSKLTWRLALIASRRRLGFEAGETTKTNAGQPAGNRRAGKAQLLADLGSRQTALPPQTPRSHRSDAPSSLLAMVYGLEDRFSSPVAPSVRYRLSHSRVRRSLRPNSAATILSGRPSSTIRRIISARPRGVVRAFLCGLFILEAFRGVFGRKHLQAFNPDEQPPQKWEGTLSATIAGSALLFRIKCRL